MYDDTCKPHVDTTNTIEREEAKRKARMSFLRTFSVDELREEARRRRHYDDARYAVAGIREEIAALQANLARAEANLEEERLKLEAAYE